MKKFEKWFSELDDAQITRFTKQNRIIAKLAWEAALEWALEKLDKIYAGDFSNSEIVDTIKQELLE